ncbi:hypothetical protein BMG523Draft_04674 [Frankia sp. BMG5.23]|nr:hypothetical protein BMG523Draft_04674 [Frankia sp. BMG5.23]
MMWGLRLIVWLIITKQPNKKLRQIFIVNNKILKGRETNCSNIIHQKELHKIKLMPLKRIDRKVYQVQVVKMK